MVPFYFFFVYETILIRGIDGFHFRLYWQIGHDHTQGLVYDIQFFERMLEI